MAQEFTAQCFDHSATMYTVAVLCGGANSLWWCQCAFQGWLCLEDCWLGEAVLLLGSLYAPAKCITSRSLPSFTKDALDFVCGRATMSTAGWLAQA